MMVRVWLFFVCREKIISKIFKNLALDNITKVCLPTDCDILGFVVEQKFFFVDKNNILVIICEGVI